MIAAAPTRPVTWVLAPACSATAVREPLVLTGNPWKRPAATFAAPIPIISPLPSTSWPVRAANADAVEIVSVSATRAIPMRPAISSGRSETGSGMVNGGKPCGSTPTSLTPWSARSNNRRRDDRQHHGNQHGRDLGQPALRAPGSVPGSRTPIASAAATVSPAASPFTNPVASSIRPSASTEKPNSFGSWPITIVSASPFM